MGNLRGLFGVYSMHHIPLLIFERNERYGYSHHHFTYVVFVLLHVFILMPFKPTFAWYGTHILDPYDVYFYPIYCLHMLNFSFIRNIGGDISNICS